MPTPRRGLVVAIVSGKGGTGKSLLAVNLAETMARNGRTVALLDADPCQSSCATLMNEEPPVSLVAVARGVVPASRAFHRTAAGITLIVGGTTTNWDGDPPDLHHAFDDALELAIDTHDIVLIDAPAGLDGAVRWALDRADTALLVVVGEPTAVTGAYALCKAVWQAIPQYPFLSVVNAADTDADATDTADRFGALTRQFLGQAPTPIGWLPYDAHVRAAVRAQVPVIRRSAALRASFAGLAATLGPLLSSHSAPAA